METRDVVVDYLDRVRARSGWEDLLAEDLRFTNYTDPVKRAMGKQSSLEGIRRFYGMAKSMEVTQIIVDGALACVQTRYELEPPSGRSFESHVAEVFEVGGGRITALGIYFDSAPYPKPPPAANPGAS